LKRNKTALVFGITLAIAAALGACGNKKPMEMTLEESSVIDLHQTETTASGGTVEDVASELMLSAGTVRNYVSSAMDKTHAHTRAEALKVATENGWL